MKKKKKNNLKRNVFQVVSVGMALMMPMTSIAATASGSGIDTADLQQYDGKTWGDSATETAADDSLNDHAENTYDGKIHLFFDTTGGQWLDPSQDGPEGSETNAHDNGTYVITIPTKIAYENMNIGIVDTSDTYDVNIRGAIGQNEKVKLTAETDKPLVNGDKSEITETTHMGANADEAVYGERTFDSSQVYGSLNGDGSLAGTTVQDTITMKGEVTTVGVYEGSVLYKAELVKDSTTEKPDTPENPVTPVDNKKDKRLNSLNNKLINANNSNTPVSVVNNTVNIDVSNNENVTLKLDLTADAQADPDLEVTNSTINVADTNIATASVNKIADNSYEFVITPQSNGETTATVETTFNDNETVSQDISITVENKTDKAKETSVELVNGGTFNANIKSLTSDRPKVKKVIRTTTEPEDTFTDISLAQNGSAKMSFDSSTGTLNLWTSADKFKLNSDSGGMFDSCTGIETLDLSNFDTSNVTSMSWMFYNCSSLKTLNISKFDTSKVTNMSEMFEGCSSLKTIYVSDAFDTSKIDHIRNGSNNIFSNCIALVGGNGTTYDANHTDDSYAHIDKADNPGYFTEKK